MKNNRKILMGVSTALLAFLAACGNSSEDTNSTVKKENENASATQNTKKDSIESDSKEDASKTVNTDPGTDETEKSVTKNKVDTSDTSNKESKKEEVSINKTVSLKEEYLKKLEDTKKNTDQIRNNPIDDTTFALKKVEGDVFDTWDGMLNEIYGVLKKQLSSGEMEQLKKEQREWITHRDETAKEESLKYKGGTAEQLEYVKVENNLTIDRCFELVKKYMK